MLSIQHTVDPAGCLFRCRHIDRSSKSTFTSLPKFHPSSHITNMVLEIPRRRFLRTINSKYIYGRVVSLSQQCPACTLYSGMESWRLVSISRNRQADTINFYANKAFSPSFHILRRDGHYLQNSSQIQYLLCRTSK